MRKGIDIIKQVKEARYEIEFDKLKKLKCFFRNDFAPMFTPKFSKVYQQILQEAIKILQSLLKRLLCAIS